MDQERFIEARGGYYTLDTQGFICNTTRYDLLPITWRPAVTYLTDVLKKLLPSILHSVYIRGSAPRGEAVDFVSDLDVVVLVQTLLTIEQKQKLQVSVSRAERLYPHIHGIDCNIVVTEELPYLVGSRIMLATQSLCVYGTDIISSLPKLKPGLQTVQHVFGIAREVQQEIKKLAISLEPAEIQKQCAWIMKRLLRTGSELVMEKQQRYSRDLWYCYDMFRQAYPEQDRDMYRVLELAVSPAGDRTQVLEVLCGIGSWLGVEVERVFDQKFLNTHKQIRTTVFKN